MVLLLSSHDVAEATVDVDAMKELIPVIETALRDMATNDRPRSPMATPSTAAGPMVVGAFGLLPGCGVAGGRMHLVGKPRHPTAPRHSAYKVLYDLDTLNLAAILEDAPVHRAMLGARVAVATDHLAPREATSVAVIGSGAMARASLQGIAAVRRIEAAAVFSPDADHRAAFAAWAAKELGIDVATVERAETAVKSGEIVTCATSNHFRGGTSVFRGDWVAPGTHVNSIARGEVDPAMLPLARVVPPSWPELLAIHPDWDGVACMVEAGELKPSADLAAIVAGARPGRVSRDERTVYLGPSTGPEHVAVARWVVERARSMELGTYWELDRAAAGRQPG